MTEPLRDVQNAAANATAEARETAHREKQAYAHGEHRPLGGYVRAMGVYGGVVGALAGVAWRTGRRPPATVGPWDAFLLTVGTMRLSRTIAKDSVTSPLRAPFTRYEGRSGESELAEQVRAEGGVRKAVGELVTCPFCIGQWVATGFLGGLVFAPRFTRLVAAGFTALFGADLLQFVYAKVQQWGTS